MFRNGACMCAAQTLAHVRNLAVAARDQSAFAAVGARGSAVMPLAILNPPLPACPPGLFENQDMLNGPIDEVTCVRGPLQITGIMRGPVGLAVLQRLQGQKVEV